MKVLRGYADTPTADPCPSCGGQHFAFDDDGNPETVLVRCWCGATARCRRDDPDLPVELARDDAATEAGREYLAALRRSTTSPRLLAAIDDVEANMPRGEL